MCFFKEIDLTRKLSESYDMQEKLVADNADLEVKRFAFRLMKLECFVKHLKKGNGDFDRLELKIL